MEVILIELLLWVALFFMFWAMKDSLTQVENEIDALRLMRRGQGKAGRAGEAAYASPEYMSDPIGTYQDVVIYSYAVIDGRKYQFDHVQPTRRELPSDQRCIAPGLVYVPCE